MEEHPQARFIVETLAQAGFCAYYAGGWVRDFLLKHPSDDIDIATNAPPETIQALFPHTVPIGIAFGIILVIVDGCQYEVATFRQDMDYHDGRRPSKIAFSTAQEDAKRRDFTINGMFYDPLKNEILDFVGGREDLNKKLIRAIGDPHQRIREDRLRMVRAIRLSCRFGFKIDPKTEDAIRAHATELFPAVAIERVCQEFKKGLDFGKLHPMLIKLHKLSLLGAIFPQLLHVSEQEIEKRLHFIDHYPKEAPLIAFLLPLFPNASLDEQLALCQKLKLSNQDVQFTSFLFHANALLKSSLNQELQLVEWARFYAHHLASIALRIFQAHLDPAHQGPFLQNHNARIKELSSFIERIQKKNPVVRASDLMQEGIQPGQAMGKLLERAEQISVNQQIDDPKRVIEQLKNTDLWLN